jgi:glyoxylase-like metal-dependent hydrolase (beta-lactamase superfamily II)
MATGDGTASIHRISLPMSAGSHSDSRTVNSFLLPGRPLTLVDAGMPSPESLRALEAGLAERGARLAEVEQLVVTHTHPDHYGGAAAIARAAGAAGRRVRVLAHPRAAAILSDLPRWWQQAREHSRDVLRRAGAPARLLDGAGAPRPAERPPYLDAATTVAVDELLADGDVVETGAARWRVHYTPGHASTQICLHEPATQELLSSDHLLRDVTANMVLEPPWPGEPAAHPILDYLASLRRLQALPVARVWPGHGAAFEDAQATIRARIERCLERLEQAAALVSGARKTAWEVAEAIYAGTPAAGSPRGLFQVVAYLDALIAQGRVAATDEDGIWRYHNTAA